MRDTPRMGWAILGLLLGTQLTAAEMPRIRLAPEGRGFVVQGTQKPFIPWGFNYDRDHDGRLIEDYWLTEWPRVEGDFAEMKQLGANVVRVHLQFGQFLSGPDRLNETSLRQLERLLRLAEREGLYVDLTGLGCYHKKDVPAWYDALDEAGRWNAQARFWQALAKTARSSPAIFCYDLMNEPVVPGGRRNAGDWLGPPFAGKHFVQVVTLDQANRPRPEIARLWTRRLVQAIREVDPDHLVTVGLVDWSLDRPGLTSGFVPRVIAPEIDFLCVHVYPDKKKLDEARATLAGFAETGKPIVVEETFPLACSSEDLDRFITEQSPRVAGWISFYWGKPPDELKRSKTLHDAILLEWLERFSKRSPARQAGP